MGWTKEIKEYIKTCTHNKGDHVVLLREGTWVTGFNLDPTIDKNFLLPEQDYYCTEITTITKHTIINKYALPLVNFERIK